MFPHFETVQIVHVDKDSNPRFRKLLNTLQEKESMAINIMAIVTPLNKFTIFDNTDEFEGWFDDLIKADEATHVNPRKAFLP